MKLSNRLLRSSGGDPYWPNVALLIQPPDDAVDGSTTITDRSPSARTVTRYGDTQVDTSLGYPTVLFDGNGDYLTVPAASIFNFTSVPTTLELLLTPVGSVGTAQYVMALRNDTGSLAAWAITLSSARIITFNCWSSSSAYSNLGSVDTLTAGQLYHVEFSVDSAFNMRMFVNGAYQGLLNISGKIRTVSRPLFIGRPEQVATWDYFNGHQRVRWSPVARHQTNDNFTHPTKFIVG